MTINKQDFYIGAALHMLVKGASEVAFRWAPPFYCFADGPVAYIKYCTRGRSPWSFTFSGDEQSILGSHDDLPNLVIGLVCGSDGVAAVPYEEFAMVAAPRQAAVHIGVHRKHGGHYELTGPDGALSRKISPSRWQQLTATAQSANGVNV